MALTGIPQRVPVASIQEGERRREEYGDVEGLADDIRQHGLLHPVAIDVERNLIAGGRRLRAVKLLGWETVPVMMFPVTSEAERREVELAENVNRKDFTSQELLKRFDKAKEVLRNRAEREEVSPPNGGETSKGGRPAKPDSDVNAAKLIGVPLRTVERAQQDAAAEERYPVLKTVPTQADRLKVAARLDAMPEPERTDAIAKLEQNDPDTQDDDESARATVTQIGAHKPSESDDDAAAAAKVARIFKEGDLVHRAFRHLNRATRLDASEYVKHLGGLDAIDVFLENDLAIIEAGQKWLQEYAAALRVKLGMVEQPMRRVK